MKNNRVYLVGIKGVGMTSLAVYLKQSGAYVAGSDTQDIFQTDKILNSFNIPIFKGFYQKNLNNSYTEVIVTGAHGGMLNIEARQSVKLGIPTYMHGAYLGKIMRGKFSISVAGCHGKTTTSALIAFILNRNGYQPSYVIGAPEISDIGPAGHFSRGKYLVLEADEYMTCPQTDKTPRFLWQQPQMEILTNIEYDHPDAFKNIEEVKISFLKFIQKLSVNGLLIACLDDGYTRQILPLVNVPLITYGFSPQADFYISKCYFGENVSFMRVSAKSGIEIGEFMLSVPGKHNMLNALSASIAANYIGLGWDKIKEAVKSFKGAKRRFEFIEKIKNSILIDDYAHHPSEIMATIQAARDWYPNKKIIAIFQPHTFSRTKMLMAQFAKSFILADIAIITDIFSSKREIADYSVSASKLVDEAKKVKNNCLYLKNKQAVVNFLKDKVEDNYIILTLGAGDIYTWHQDIKNLR